jgi:hypothetical protein
LRLHGLCGFFEAVQIVFGDGDNGKKCAHSLKNVYITNVVYYYPALWIANNQRKDYLKFLRTRLY